MGIGVIYLPYPVDPMLATSVVTETPMEVEAVHNVVFLEHSAIHCRGILGFFQPLWSQHHFPTEMK
jgi:hypothetical protein